MRTARVSLIDELPMSTMSFRLCLVFAFCAVALATTFWPGDANEEVDPTAVNPTAQTLAIGSAAPALDIEHWIHDGNGFFQPVKSFDPGKVYVVEFWATWCGPCVSSMPHLADLQNAFRGRGVQIISVSDEPLETVEKFLARETETPGGEPTTFNDITSAYSLTTDPDRSVYEAFMEASDQQGIPTAFIVGKTGKIEWIGHPMEMDEVLEAVVAGTWDHEQFATLHQAEGEFNIALQKVSVKAGASEYAEALELIRGEMAKDLPKEIRDRWVMIFNRVRLSAGQIDADVVAYFNDELKQGRGDAIAVARSGWSIYQASREVKGLDELLDASAKAIESETATMDAESKPVVFDTLAHIYQAIGDLDKAIVAQQAAVDATEGRTQTRMQAYLDELQAAKQEASGAAK